MTFERKENQDENIWREAQNEQETLANEKNMTKGEMENYMRKWRGVTNKKGKRWKEKNNKILYKDIKKIIPQRRIVNTTKHDTTPTIRNSQRTVINELKLEIVTLTSRNDIIKIKWNIQWLIMTYIAQLQIDQQKYNKINCRQYKKRGINMVCVFSTNRFVR